MAHPGAGIYHLTLASPPADGDILVLLTADADSAGGATVAIATVLAGVITVNTLHGAGIATGATTDADFYIVVFNNT